MTPDLVSSAFDWRSFGAFSAFLAALFTEMYGFPLTLCLLAAAWNVLYEAQRAHRLATTGPYARYAAMTPGFLPRLGALNPKTA